MNISEPFIRRPIATALLMAALLVGGVIGYNLLPVAALPSVDFPTISVSASLPGASPDIMASSVAQPLERQFADLPGVNQITSTSVQGTTSITLQFDLSRNIDGAAGDVQAAINAAQRPLAEAAAQSADLQKGQPGRQAGFYPRPDLRRDAAAAARPISPTSILRSGFRCCPGSGRW